MSTVEIQLLLGNLYGIVDKFREEDFSHKLYSLRFESSGLKGSGEESLLF